MERHFNRVTRIIIAGTLAIIIWIVGVIIGQEQTVTILNPEGGLGGLISRSRTAQVSLMLDYGTGEIKVYPEIKLSYGSSVLDLLDRINNLESEFNLNYSLEDNIELTSFTISDYPNILDGKNWLVWIDNGLQVDDYNLIKLKSGDNIELKYIKLKE